jgi:DHA1 family bicyclomycin/chloramphenicol resistance-like MFS transporter
LGTFVAGPLSDTFGRKRIMAIGSLLYIIGAAVAWATHSLELMLLARAVQGFGGAGPRIVAMAVTRDLFAGREMARIVSFVMMVFALVPGFAPAMSVGIISLMGWRGIYLAFILFSMIVLAWMVLRLPETLPAERRRPLRLGLIGQSVIEVFTHSTVRLSILVQTIAMATLISMIMIVHPIYDQIYDRAASFPYWFGGTALAAAGASWINAILVVRLGMRRLVTWSFAALILLSAVIWMFELTQLAEPYGFAVFLGWQLAMFLHAGLTLGNLNAIGMEPMGHIAGMAASIIGGVSTVFAAVLAAPVIFLLGDTVTPSVLYILVLSIFGLLLLGVMARVERAQRIAEMPVFVRHKKKD